MKHSNTVPCVFIIFALMNLGLLRHRSIVLAILALLGGAPFAVLASAQSDIVQVRPYADHKRFYLGASVGSYVQHLRLSNNGLPLLDGTKLYAEVPHWRLGINVGTIAGVVLTPGLELRAMPTLQIGEIPIAYSDGELEAHSLSVRMTTLGLPLQIKYATDRLGNIRPYVAGGVYGSINLSAGSADVVRLKRLDAGIRLSVGCDIYLSYFKLSPELSYSIGLGDALVHQRPELEGDNRFRYTQALSSGRIRMIALMFTFQ